MQTRRRTRGAGHGKPSAKKYRHSLRRLEQSIRNANAAAQSLLNAKRMSRRKGMSNIGNAMNVSQNLRRSSRRVVQASTMKSIRKRAREQQEKNMKKMAESYQQVLKDAKKAEKARTEAELNMLMSRFGL